MTDHVFVVVVAILLDLLLGDPRGLPHPVVGIGRLIAFLETPLRRLFSDERQGGIALLCLTVGITCLSGALLLKGAALIHPGLAAATAIYLSWGCLAARSLHRESATVVDALQQGDLPGARHWLSRIVGRDTRELDEGDIIRGVVETVAENTSDGVIAPLLCLMLGGPVLGLAYKAINTLDSMVGYKNDRYLQFGWASARCDDLANYLPARLTGLLMIVAAPFVGLSAGNSWRIMRRDGHNHSSPNSGIPEAAAAGALGVRLGGLNYYFGMPVAKPTIGDPDRPLAPVAYRGAVRLMYGSEALLMAGFILFSAISHR
ncbi:adenosylcobinamide-phosphate synthase CbiB [Geotalea sp. SG265]|uniref:adenosylcobinamide-phosphate synthase CbiB n=1 Tax=Geotalea sp. SG265 TaxID=2922867 RepID=UPI001FAEDCC6